MEGTTEAVPWDSVAAVRSSTTRKAVFEAVAEKPRCASEIAPQVDMATETVSKHLRWLKQNDTQLVTCLTPERPHHRLYGLTEKGEAVAENL